MDHQLPEYEEEVISQFQVPLIKTSLDSSVSWCSASHYANLYFWRYGSRERVQWLVRVSAARSSQFTAWEGVVSYWTFYRLLPAALQRLILIEWGSTMMNVYNSTAQQEGKPEQNTRPVVL